MDSLDCSDVEGGCVLAVKARPGARQNAIAGIHDGALRVKVTTAPEKGKANKTISQVLAKALGVPKSSVEITSGMTSSRKKVLVKGLNCVKLLKLLQEIFSA